MSTSKEGSPPGVSGVKIPGVYTHGLDIDETGSSGSGASETTGVAAGTAEVCAPKVQPGGFRPSVYRPSVYRSKAYRSSVCAAPWPTARQVAFPKGVFPPSGSIRISVDAVEMPAVEVPPAELPAVQLPEAPGLDVFQGQGQTAYVVPTDVLFDFDKSEFRPDAVAAMRQVAASLAQRFPDAPVEMMAIPTPSAPAPTTRVFRRSGLKRCATGWCRTCR